MILLACTDVGMDVYTAYYTNRLYVPRMTIIWLDSWHHHTLVDRSTYYSFVSRTHSLFFENHTWHIHYSRTLIVNVVMYSINQFKQRHLKSHMKSISMLILLQVWTPSYCNRTGLHICVGNSTQTQTGWMIVRIWEKYRQIVFEKWDRTLLASIICYNVLRVNRMNLMSVMTVVLFLKWSSSEAITDQISIVPIVRIL